MKELKEWLTENSWVDSSISETANDFKKSDGWWNWDKIKDEEAKNIIMTTQRDSGKTFGCTDYYARIRNSTVAFLVNSQKTAEAQIHKMLDALQGKSDPPEKISRYTKEDLDRKEFYEKWYVDGMYICDGEGKHRIWVGGVTTYASAKGIRDFLPLAVIYDEFNQNVKLVEQKQTRAKEKLDFITGTLRTREWEPEHLYMFANKNSPGTPIQACTLLIDLGITSLGYLNEITRVYNTIPGYEEFKNEKIYNTFIINPKFTKEQRLESIKIMLANKTKFKWDLDLLLTENGNANLYNEDSMSYDDLVVNTFRLKIGREQLHFYGYISCANGNILEVSRWYNSAFTFVKHVRRIKPKDLEAHEIFAWKKIYKEGQFLLDDSDKREILEDIYNNQISYEDTISRVEFMKEIL